MTLTDHAEYYRNRKSYFPVVQTIGDANLKIHDIVASWPGATHDSAVLKGSAIKARFENGEMGDSMLVGDNGYPILPYLIVPKLHPIAGVETLFKESKIQTRNPVKRCLETVLETAIPHSESRHANENRRLFFYYTSQYLYISSFNTRSNRLDLTGNENITSRTFRFRHV